MAAVGGWVVVAVARAVRAAAVAAAAGASSSRIRRAGTAGNRCARAWTRRDETRGRGKGSVKLFVSTRRPRMSSFESSRHSPVVVFRVTPVAVRADVRESNDGQEDQPLGLRPVPPLRAGPRRHLLARVNEARCSFSSPRATSPVTKSSSFVNSEESRSLLSSCDRCRFGLEASSFQSVSQNRLGGWISNITTWIRLRKRRSLFDPSYLQAKAAERPASSWYTPSQILARILSFQKVTPTLGSPALGLKTWPKNRAGSASSSVLPRRLGRERVERQKREEEHTRTHKQR